MICLRFVLTLSFIICINFNSSSSIANYFIQFNNDTINQTDDKGMKQGYWQKQHKNGNIWYKGYFKDNKPVGLLTRFYESGNKKAELLHDENSDSVDVKFFYENGKIASKGVYVNNKKEGEWLFYSYYDNTLKSKEYYNNDKKHGEQIVYYENGKPSETINWVNGTKDGEWVQYFNNGHKKLKGTYVEGKLNGSFTMYYLNGAPEIIGMYKQNKFHGKWVYYDEQGQVSSTIEYNDGRPVNMEKFNEKDKVFFEQIEKNIGTISEPSPEDLLP